MNQYFTKVEIHFDNGDYRAMRFHYFADSFFLAHSQLDYLLTGLVLATPGATKGVILTISREPDTNTDYYVDLFKTPHEHETVTDYRNAIYARRV